MDAGKLFAPTFSAVLLVLVAMAAVALLETLIPLHARGYWHRAHLKTNLCLTLLALTANLFLNAGLLALVLWLESRQFGLLRWLSIPALPAGVIAVLALDLTFYATHFSWHKIPLFWRFHAVHHSDPALDVTTTIRQHPMDSLMHYATMAVAVLALGPSPGAFAAYRLALSLTALLEHANISVPRWLDRLLSLVTSWPHMHKVHHSRVPSQTDSNYGNLFSFWDRLFGTYTPSSEGTKVSFGLDGLDDQAIQTPGGLLGLPFRERRTVTTATG